MNACLFPRRAFGGALMGGLWIVALDRCICTWGFLGVVWCRGSGWVALVFGRYVAARKRKL